MPIPYKQLDRNTGKWVTKYKEVTVVEQRRPMEIRLYAKKKDLTTVGKVIGVFRANSDSLTREEIFLKLKGSVNNETLRKIIYQLVKMGKVIKYGSIINEAGNRCHQFKIKIS